MQTRSFCYISDQLEGQILAMDSENTKGEVFNVGNDDERTILEFAKKVKDLANSKSEVVFEKLPIDDPKQRKPDITKAKNVLGWKPQIGLEAGLLETISYFKTIL
jgi:nucleoside-diphosphate-sugar epimerase